MKILFVSPAIEEKSRGIGAIFRTLVESAKHDGHEVNMLLGYPEKKPFHGSRNISDKLEHLYAQHYLQDGRDSYKSIANRSKLKLALLEAFMSFSIFRSKQVEVNQNYLSGPKSLLNFSDTIVKSPFFYLILNFMPAFFSQMILNRIVRKYDIDLIVISAPTKISNKKTSAQVAHFVHDTIPIDVIEAPPTNNTPHRYGDQFQSTCANSDLIMTNSEDTKSKVLDQNPDANVHVLYGTASSRRKDVEEGKIVERLKLKKGKFLLFISTVEKRKNVSSLIKAYAQVYKDIDMPLLVVGAQGYGYDEIKQTYEDQPKSVRQNIKFVGYVTEADKFQLYDNAFAFVLPSTYEGMGLMLIEAMQAEIPIITTNKGALPEAGGDAAYYVEDPYDTEELAQAILTLHNNPKLVKDLVAKGKKQRNKFTFAKFNQRFTSAVESLKVSPKAKQEDSRFVVSAMRQVVHINMNELIVLLAIFINFFNYWPTLKLGVLGDASLEISMLTGVLVVVRGLFVYREKIVKKLLKVPQFFFIYGWVIFSGGWSLANTDDPDVILFKVLYVLSIIAAAHVVATFYVDKKLSVSNVMKGWLALALIMVPLFIVQYLLVSFGFDVFSKRAYQVGIFEFPRLHGFSFEPLFLANWLLVPLLYSLFRRSANIWDATALSTLLFLTLARGAIIAAVIVIVVYALTSRHGINSFKRALKPFVYGLLIALVLVGFASSINNSTPLQGAFRYVDHLTLGVFNSEGSSNVGTKEVVINGEVETVIDTKQIDREGAVEASTIGRLESIETGVEIFKENPALGVGLFRIGEAASERAPEYLGENTFVVNAQPIDILAETGVVGMAFVLMFFFYNSKLLIRRSIISLMLLGLGIQYLFFTNLFLISFWLILGIALVAVHEKELLYE